MRAVAVLALGAILAVWSMVAIAIDAETSTVPCHRRARRGEQVDDLGFLARVDRVLAASSARTPCPRDLMRSAVTIKLARLDGAYRKNYAIDWGGLGRRRRSAAAQRAALLSRMTAISGCSSRSVEFVRLGPTEAVEHMLLAVGGAGTRRGMDCGPADGPGGQAHRLPATVREVLRKDARTLVLHANPREVATLYFQVGDRAREVFDEALAGPVEPERRAALQNAIDTVVATLPPERRP